MWKNIIRSAAALVLFISAVTLSGCSGISDEQAAELEALRAEVKSLNSEVVSLNDQNASVDKEIANKRSKLDECAKLKAETQKNLSQIGQ